MHDSPVVRTMGRRHGYNLFAESQSEYSKKEKKKKRPCKPIDSLLDQCPEPHKTWGIAIHNTSGQVTMQHLTITLPPVATPDHIGHFPSYYIYSKGAPMQLLPPIFLSDRGHFLHLAGYIVLEGYWQLTKRKYTRWNFWTPVWEQR